MSTASSFSDGAGSSLNPGATGRKKGAATLVEVNGLPQRASSLNGQPYRLHGSPPAEEQPRLIFFPEAIAQIMAHANSNLHSEVGGVLLGAAYREGETLAVDVRAALPVQSDDHGPIHFTFNADGWSQVHRDRAANYPDLNIVGWFHTHPGLGIFFSGDDVVVHSAAFVLPWHSALVVDPLSKKMGAFAWREGELAPLAGFYERLTEEGARSRLTWQWQAGEIWDESYMERMVQRRRALTTGRDAGDEAGLQVTPWHAIALAAFSILLTLALFIGALLPLSSRNDALQQVVAELANRTIAAAGASGAASCPDPSLRIYTPLPDAQIPYGENVTVIGVAELPDTSYRLDVRPSGEAAWWSLGLFHRPVRSNEFLTWDTSSFAPGAYQLRLTAANRDGEIPAGAAACLIHFDLLPPDAAGPS